MTIRILAPYLITFCLGGLFAVVYIFVSTFVFSLLMEFGMAGANLAKRIMTAVTRRKNNS